MPKMRSFSIFLLKEEFNHENCFKDDANIGEPVNTGVLPDDALLYIFDNPSHPPWWRQYFEIELTLSQALKGAILVLEVDGRVFCITFGHVAHKLLDTAFEYDFGMQVTLNCLDPNKIKNTDTLIPASSMRQRMQVSSDTELANFDFDRQSTIVKSLTGKVRDEYKDLIKSATGGAHLRVGTDVAAEELTEFCRKLLRLYKSDDYKTYFPDLLNIIPLHDPIVIEKLNIKLLKAIHEDGDIALAIPEIVDYQNGVFIRFNGARGRREVCDDIQFSAYLDYLKERSIVSSAINIELLTKHNMYLCDEEGNKKGKAFSIYKSLVFDAEIDGDTSIYHLSEGGWYRVEGDYVKELSEYLDPLCIDQHLPDFNGGYEKDYNEMVCKVGDRANLDRTSISPNGQRQIEPCDIAELQGDCINLIHVKISTQSSLLSHLFNQGINSFDLLRANFEARQKLKRLLEKEKGLPLPEAWTKALSSNNFSVSYAIVTHKDAGKKSKNFPLFSRIGLYRIMKDFETRGITRSYQFVK